jgi:hypothetical protein
MSTIMLPDGSVIGRPAPIAAGRHRRLAHRALLDLGDPRRDRDHDARAQQVRAVVRLADEVAQHRLGDLEVGDHPVAQRPHRADRAGRAAQHALGLLAHGAHAVALGVDRDHRRLGRDDPAPLGVDQRVGSAQIDGEVVGEQAEEAVERLQHGAFTSLGNPSKEEPRFVTRALKGGKAAAILRRSCRTRKAHHALQRAVSPALERRSGCAEGGPTVACRRPRGPTTAIEGNRPCATGCAAS